MATYISLLRYTHQGATSVKESPGRVDAAAMRGLLRPI